MDTMAISKFKATCLAALERGSLEIRGDIVAPSSTLVKWEALE